MCGERFLDHVSFFHSPHDMWKKDALALFIYVFAICWLVVFHDGLSLSHAFLWSLRGTLKGCRDFMAGEGRAAACGWVVLFGQEGRWVQESGCSVGKEWKEVVLTDLYTFACLIGRGQRHWLALPMQMGVVRLLGRIQLSERGVGAWLEDTSVCV